MKLLKAILFSMLLFIPSATQPFQGLSEKTKKYLKAALYGAAAATSGYLAYCCIRDLYHASSANFNAKTVVTAIEQEIDKQKYDLQNKTEYNNGLERGKELTNIILDYTSYESFNTDTLISEIKDKKEKLLTCPNSDKPYDCGIRKSATIATETIRKQSKRAFSTKDIFGVVVGSCATIHFGHEAVRYLKDGDSVDLSIRPQINNGTIQSSMSVGFTMSR